MFSLILLCVQKPAQSVGVEDVIAALLRCASRPTGAEASLEYASYSSHEFRDA